MRNTLLIYIINRYIYISILLYLIIFIYWSDNVLSYSFFNFINVFFLLCYIVLTYVSYFQPDKFYTNVRLVITTFVYVFCGMMTCCYLSDYYTGNTFFWSMNDAMIYYKWANRLIQIDVSQWIDTLNSANISFDDWGGIIIPALIFKIYPSKITLNIFYVILTTIASLSIFRIGKTIMMKRYAYIAALTYSTSSYLLRFNSTFTKELVMTFIIIESFYYLYKYINEEKIIYLIVSFAISIFIAFYRIPVMVFFWLAVITYLLFKKKDIQTSTFFILAAIYIASLSLTVIVEAIDRYTVGGDITKSGNYTHATTFSIYTSIINVCIGPFPDLYRIDNSSAKSIFGSGLLFKLFLAFPFWIGLLLCIKEKVKKMFPLFVFSLLDIIGLALVNDGIEYRKAYPHVLAYILCSFWYLSEYDEDANDEVKNSPYYRRVRFLFHIVVFIIFVATLIWNTYRIDYQFNDAYD